MTAPGRLDRSGYELDHEDTFDGPELDRSRWLPYYLPHWSSRERSAARYRLTDGHLVLAIEEDQAPWAPEHDGRLRVSNLQTGTFSGPVGSTAGQHHFTPGLRVTEEQPAEYLWTPHRGIVEVRLAALDDPRTLVALWMIGLEDVPERSAEICVVEIFGTDVHDDHVVVGMGVHPFGDPTILDDLRKVRVDVDAREMHTYAVEWTEESLHFFVDDDHVTTVDQSPDYPVQLMLDIYELEGPPSGTYPKELHVEHVRSYRPRGADRPR